MSNPFAKYLEATQRQQAKSSAILEEWANTPSKPHQWIDIINQGQDNALLVQQSKAQKLYQAQPQKSVGDYLGDTAVDATKAAMTLAQTGISALDLGAYSLGGLASAVQQAGHEIAPNAIPQPKVPEYGQITKVLDDGLGFNIGKAKYYCTLLEQRKDELYSIIRPYLNYSIINEENRSKDGLYEFEYVKKIKLKNGEYTRSVTSWFPDDPTVVDAEFSRISIEEPSISKRDQVTKALLRSGWEPTEFTETGKPKLTEKGQPVDTLSQVGEFGKALADWYTYNHRKSQINGFFEHVRKDGRIAAQCQPCATNTFRAKHRVVANIPRPSSLFGKEMRSLFCAAPGKVLPARPDRAPAPD